MKVQQYTMRSNGKDFTPAKIGQFVFQDASSDIAIGFISDTDAETFIEVTLFDPIEQEALPIDMERPYAVVDWSEVFHGIADLMEEEVRAGWEQAIDESSQITLQ